MTPIRFAYADPPYPGKSRRYYREHPDYGGEVDHAVLIDRLEREFPDGWALSTSQAALADILPLCPPPIPRGAVGGGSRPQFRVLSWCKRTSQPGGRPGPLYGWEPVILRGGRSDPDRVYPNDWLVCSVELYQLRPRPAGHVTGAKPPDFCRWLFACAGLGAGDEFVDLFPGSDAVGDQWRRWAEQEQLRRVESVVAMRPEQPSLEV